MSVQIATNILAASILCVGLIVLTAVQKWRILSLLDFGFYNIDCMDGMKGFPDKYFDLAVVDPPYGDAQGGDRQVWSAVRQIQNRGGTTDSEDGSTATRKPVNHAWGGRFERYRNPLRGRGMEQKVLLPPQLGTIPSNEQKLQRIEWDIAPSAEYFNELFRVSKNQIIWGGNYFSLPPTRCFLIWRKLSISEKFSMAMAEYAWTSFNQNAKVFEAAPQGTAKEPRFHATQKPIALYEWILNLYAKENDIILDTHVGSASSLIACHRTGHKFVGFEIDEYYYEMAKKRLEAEQAQMTLFDLTKGGKEGWKAIM